MPRNNLTKIDMLSRVYKWKHNLEFRNDMSHETKIGYDKALNDILELLKEFRE